METVRGNPAVIFDDTRIAPHGQKLMGNFQFALTTGETGTAMAYISPGHNSAYYDAGLGKYFLIFHTRFPLAASSTKFACTNSCSIRKDGRWSRHTDTRRSR